MLAWEGYNVLTAKDGVEALAVMERQTVELILTDLKMPRLGGRELARRVAARWPGVRMVFMTGHFELSLTDNLPGPLVLKPFSLEDLVDTVKSLLDPANRSAP
jgi:CheY-like chemotaxis protein